MKSALKLSFSNIHEDNVVFEITFQTRCFLNLLWRLETICRRQREFLCGLQDWFQALHILQWFSNKCRQFWCILPDKRTNHTMTDLQWSLTWFLHLRRYSQYLRIHRSTTVWIFAPKLFGNFIFRQKNLNFRAQNEEVLIKIIQYVCLESYWMYQYTSLSSVKRLITRQEVTFFACFAFFALMPGK